MPTLEANELSQEMLDEINNTETAAVIDDTGAQDEAEKQKKKQGRHKPLTEIPKVIKVPAETAEILESIMFAAGHAVPYTVLARVLELPVAKTKQLVYSYSLTYNDSPVPRGVMMLTFDDACQLCTKQQYLPFIREALGIRRGGNLSNSSIETLAIIAYNQPVTRSYVDTVRGVDSSYAIGSLLERNLIESKGRVDAPGRPMLYGTTSDFLRCFGLSSLTELPGVTSEEAVEMLAKINREMEDQLNPDKNQIAIDASAIPADPDDFDEDAPIPDKTAVAIGETLIPEEE